MVSERRRTIPRHMSTPTSTLTGSGARVTRVGRTSSQRAGLLGGARVAGQVKRLRTGIVHWPLLICSNSYTATTTTTITATATCSNILPSSFSLLASSLFLLPSSFWEIPFHLYLPFLHPRLPAHLPAHPPAHPFKIYPPAHVFCKPAVVTVILNLPIHEAP